MKYVKVIIEDENQKTLFHHYIAKDYWGVPAGQIEENETPEQAAVRELLERTGFSIDINKLEAADPEENFYIFKGKKEDIVKVAEPGEKGGYETEIRWE